MATEKKSLEAVAKHLRFNLRTKAAVLKREKVEYFTGSAAVDTLMKSKWSRQTDETSEEDKVEPRKADDENTPAFYTRADAVNFCKRLTEMHYMVRVNKVEVKPASDNTDTGDDESGQPASKQDQTVSKQGKVGDAAEQPVKKQAKAKTKGEEGGKKRKKRYRFEIHAKQQFRDADDLYIWKYNPPSMSSYVIGFIVVLGAIAWTLQPLWPASTRVAMWYIAIVAACVIGALLVLLVLRWFLFGIVLVATLGKVQFWVFPNLNEEKYGFVDSFKPVYTIERSGDS